MVRKPRDYKAEEARRNELAKQRGYANRNQARKAAGGRNYTAEYQRRKQLRTDPDYVPRPRWLTLARRWASFRALYPDPARQTTDQARRFVSGLGEMGATGIPNRHAGYVASKQQVRDRSDFERIVRQESKKWYGQVYSMGEQWWTLWRDEYSANYL